jgi:hypothetical protein
VCNRFFVYKSSKNIKNKANSTFSVEYISIKIKQIAKISNKAKKLKIKPSEK